MKNQFSDEKLDLILKAIVDDARLSDETIGEIADSPQLWWGVQRTIAGQKPAPRFGWLPSFDWRIVTFAGLVIAAFLGLIVFTRSGDGLNVAGSRTTETILIERPVASSPVAETVSEPSDEVRVARTVSKRQIRRRTADPVRSVERSPSEQTVKIETKSEFIALMYSQEPESGQLLKVKVPRSMMVALGVSTNVQNSSEFVNAEVLMGDDGSARAIRFIQ